MEFWRTQEEVTWLQLELNTQIAKLRLQVPPLMPPEVIIKRKNIISMGHGMITQSLEECTELLN